MVNKLTYDHTGGGKSSYPLPMGASEVIKAKSGRFVKDDGSGRGELAGDGDTRLKGWVESGDLTCSATEGATILNCCDDVTAVYTLPLRYDGVTYTVNYSDALLGKKHDLVIVSNVQYANVTHNSEKTIIVVGGKAATSASSNDGYLKCRMNPSKLHEAD